MNKLIETEAIKQLKARYFRYLDAKNWEALRECLSDDVTFDYPPGKIHVSGGEALIANFRKRHATTKTAHTGSMPEIIIKNTNEAEGIWFMTDYVVSIGEDEQQIITQGFGHYFETYLLVDGYWKIKSILLERLLLTQPNHKLISIL
jgi:hypothetical protein